MKDSARKGDRSRHLLNIAKKICKLAKGHGENREPAIGAEHSCFIKSRNQRLGGEEQCSSGRQMKMQPKVLEMKLSFKSGASIGR